MPNSESWTRGFPVGLLVPFVNQALGRLRMFLLVSLLVLTVVQHWAARFVHRLAEINSETCSFCLAPWYSFTAPGCIAVIDQLITVPAVVRHLVTEFLCWSVARR